MRGNGGIIGAQAISGTVTAPGMWGINDGARRQSTNFADLSATWPTLGDPHFANVTLLCHFDQYVESSGTVFVEKGPNSLNLIQQGLAGDVLGGASTVQSKFSHTSLLVNAQRRGAVNRGTSSVAFGTGDFTMELWFYQLSSGAAAQVLLDLSASDGNVSAPLWETLATTNKLAFFHNPTAAVNITGGTTVTANAWHHVHVTRSSGTTYMGMDGTQEGSDYTDSNTYGSASTYVGQLTDTNTGGQGFQGYIAELRITTGFARYTRTYTVPTARFPDH